MLQQENIYAAAFLTVLISKGVDRKLIVIFAANCSYVKIRRAGQLAGTPIL
ncbi:hypothetical protein HMPREF1548_01981 [Clostridium sp. KLE 1755]|jgi:hypothetical protein|nr:hypothetical protein HMPREF1548_01981 [Clostridium sp. KLE 1755]